MPAREDAREPGWLWVRVSAGGLWHPCRWDGKMFWFSDNARYRWDDLAEIGPRIEPPTAPAQSQPERTPSSKPSLTKHLTNDTHRLVWDWAQAFRDAKVDLDGECAEVHANLDACNRFAMRFEPDGSIYLMLFGKRKHLTEWLPPTPTTITGEASE